MVMLLLSSVEVKVLLNECYKNYRFRPDMKTIVEMIQMWQPDNW